MQGSKHFRVHYVVGSPLKLVEFIDSDWDGDSIDKNALHVMYSFLHMVPHVGKSRNNTSSPYL